MPITYAELLVEVPVWLMAQNRDISDDIPEIVRNAHHTLMGRIDHDIFKAVLDTLVVGPPATPTPGTDYSLLDLSADNLRVLEVRALRFDYMKEQERTPIERRELEFLTMLYSRNRPGRPRFYAEFPTPLKYRVFPYPNREYALEATANIEPPVLGPSQQSNVIAAKYPNVMLKACLREGALFMKNQKDAATYEAELTAALTEANLSTARKRRDETAQRPQETANAVGR